ncbi:MAG: trypsin-like peptidase domain-containing protein [Bacteroidota bacterium]
MHVALNVSFTFIMASARQQHRTNVLIGIGLVVVGLLLGILVMLFVQAQQNQQTGRPVVIQEVTRAQLPMADSVALPQALEIPPQGAMNQMFTRVADAVTGSVVYIQVESDGPSGAPNDWMHRNFQTQVSTGSGVLISDDGYVVTNNHVVDGADEIRVRLFDKRQYAARLVGTDPSTDLAVIKLENASELPVLTLGDSDALRVGEWVVAVGNPFRLTSTVTTGIVSALGRRVDIIEGAMGIEDFIQTDAAINPGNSGGALVNLRGELVGINTAIATETGSNEGYGFAVPTNLMQRVVSDLIAYGEVRRGILGVTIEEVNAIIARRIGLDRVTGVLVRNVQPGGAADQAGLLPGDVVLTINGRSVGATNELQSVVARYRPGDALNLEVWRRRALRRVDVRLLGLDHPAYSQWRTPVPRRQPAPLPDMDPPPPEAERFDVEGWGIGLQDLSGRQRRRFNVDDGVYVAYVNPEGTVAVAGLPRDVVIQRIAQMEVRSIDDVLDLFSEVTDVETTVLMRVRRTDGTTAFYEVEVPVTE